MITIRYINSQYESIESYFLNKKIANNFKKNCGKDWIEYIMTDKGVVIDKSESTTYL